MNEDAYVIIKLVSGEEIMATLVEELDDYVDIINVLSLHHNIESTTEGRRESISISPFCQYTSDQEFSIYKGNIIYIKDLSISLEKKYKALSEHYFEMIHAESDNLLDDLTVSGSDKAFDDEISVTVEGNDTVH
ncbi:hypothetical protein UFOVP1666_100 [uncultured Caudovirales phage]|uniref:Uncharacterized protein n=1 Tax=uncultured Caudovirales phage TaxID=2100421 RepID=A0A6J5PJN2_9CAUD|nr:hypothetical protein UFOVP867_55 [uncultured Caudovirales phage]CAB4170921.1 hypothetical protein UFOVP913_143 [uncultured Caudovirales phage]CAB4177151.1 hypothetical protein UFOVP993_196 [uncultured Caudovirales phage]CAB4223057.1 hypothetical protein UFOVP1666_100 [uncultured Caudovirales phage]